MLAGKRSSTFIILLLLALTASGDNFSATTTVLNTTSANITGFSIVTGNVVDFLFTLNNAGNTNISAFPEVAVYDQNNNLVVTLLYGSAVNISRGESRDKLLSWNTGSIGSFTANLTVFYDSYTKTVSVSNAFEIISPSPPQKAVVSGGGGGGGGTSGFVSPKNIKEAVIGFRVMNSWLSDNGIPAADIRLIRWDGTKWVQLETKLISYGEKNIDFEARTSAFGIFAIVSVPLRSEILPVIQKTNLSEVSIPVREAAADQQPFRVNGFQMIVIIFSLLFIFAARKIRKI